MQTKNPKMKHSDWERTSTEIIDLLTCLLWGFVVAWADTLYAIHEHGFSPQSFWSNLLTFFSIIATYIMVMVVWFGTRSYRHIPVTGEVKA